MCERGWDFIGDMYMGRRVFLKFSEVGCLIDGVFYK